MKLLLIVAGITAFSVGPAISSGQAACHATVRARIDVAGEEFSLADLLGPDTCPALRRAAAEVRLGGTPLVGSARVLAGDDVRTLLEKLSAGIKNGAGRSLAISVPQRITVRRAGALAFCADLGARILAHLRGSAPNSSSAPGPVETGSTEIGSAEIGHAETIPASPAPRAVDCGAAGRIPQGTPLEFTPPVWDPALASWEVFARCVHPADCVPFLVRVEDRDREPENESFARRAGSTVTRWILASFSSSSSSSSSSFRGRAAPSPARPTLLVRPGQTVTLLWDQDGIRLVVPAVALDAGGPGGQVRARIAPRGRLVRAIVVSAGQLRAAS